MLGRVLGLLLDAGAKDAFFAPIYMKKNRPAYKLSVITDAARREKLENIIFRETTTIGIRRQTMARTILPREIIKIYTPLGPAAVKKIIGRDFVRYAPEFDDAVALAAKSGLPFGEVYAIIESAAREQEGKNDGRKQ